MQQNVVQKTGRLFICVSNESEYFDDDMDKYFKVGEIYPEVETDSDGDNFAAEGETLILLIREGYGMYADDSDFTEVKELKDYV